MTNIVESLYILQNTLTFPNVITDQDTSTSKTVTLMPALSCWLRKKIPSNSSTVLVRMVGTDCIQLIFNALIVVGWRRNVCDVGNHQKAPPWNEEPINRLTNQPANLEDHYYLLFRPKIKGGGCDRWGGLCGPTWWFFPQKIFFMHLWSCLIMRTRLARVDSFFPRGLLIKLGRIVFIWLILHIFAS